MALDSVKNLVKVTLSLGYNAVATSVVLVAGQGAKLPAAPFNLVWWNATDFPDPADDPNAEIIRVTNIATDTLTITRNQESSGASTKNTAGKTYQMALALTKKMIDDLNALIAAAASNHTQVDTFTTTAGNQSFSLTKNPALSILLVVIAQQPLNPSDFSFDAVHTVSTSNISYPAGLSAFVLYTY